MEKDPVGAMATVRQDLEIWPNPLLPTLGPALGLAIVSP